jgi:ribose 5-phosphate isomerase B
MKIAFSCDHGGFPFRDGILNHLKKSGHIVVDLWPQELIALDDFPDYAWDVSTSVLSRKTDLGVLVCGTGIGMSIAANRHKNIRAVLAYTPEIARISRSHNDANIICFWARTMEIGMVLESIDIFLSEPFLWGKYKKRNELLDCQC